jgi:hypothetical protein
MDKEQILEHNISRSKERLMLTDEIIITGWGNRIRSFDIQNLRYLKRRSYFIIVLEFVVIFDLPH